MFAYIINSHCDCGSPDCYLKGFRKTLAIFQIDPESEEEQTSIEEILEKCEPHLDEEGPIEMQLGASVTGDLFTAIEGVLAMAGTCHALLAQQKKAAEKDEFLEETLDVDSNI